MKLRHFLKSLITAPLIASKTIIAGDKPERFMVRFLEMSTFYGTPILVAIIPDGKRLIFVHGDSLHGCPWESYNGDSRDFDLVPWVHRHGQAFPDYKAIEHMVRFRYEKLHDDP